MQAITIKPGKFDEENQCWCSVNYDASERGAPSVSIKLLTYNVWFSDEYIDERSIALLGILKDSNADLMALQEVTYHFLQVLLMQEWIRRDYYISDIKGDTFSAYGVILLSRFPVKTLYQFDLPSYMERKLILAELIVKGETFKVATVHLESMKESADVRAEQLSAIFPLLDNANSAVLMGDFNFFPSTKKEDSNIDDNYSDLWNELRADEPGYTINSVVNTMLCKNLSIKVMSRIDRIIFRRANSGWRAKKIDLLGISAISKQTPDVFPSDHFGLLCELEWFIA